MFVFRSLILSSSFGARIFSHRRASPSAVLFRTNVRTVVQYYRPVTLKLAPRCGSRCRSPGPPPKPLRTRPREAPEKSRGGARPPAASAAPQASSPPSPPPAAARGGLTRAGRARPPSPPPSPGGPPGLPSPRGGGGLLPHEPGSPAFQVAGTPGPSIRDARRPAPPSWTPVARIRPRGTGAGCGVRDAVRRCPARAEAALPPSGSGRATRTLPSILERSVSYSDDGWAMDGCQGRLPTEADEASAMESFRWNVAEALRRRGGGPSYAR